MFFLLFVILFWNILIGKFFLKYLQFNTFLDKPISPTIDLFLSLGVGYGVLSFFQNLILKFIINRFSYSIEILILTSIVLLYYERTAIKSFLFQSWKLTRDDRLFITFSLLILFLSSWATIRLGGLSTPTYLGMNHADRYGAFSMSFINLDLLLPLSQHYSSSLFNATIQKLTGINIGLLNWLLHNIYKMSLLSSIYVVALYFTKNLNKSLFPIFSVLILGLGHGAVDLNNWLNIDSGNPVVLMSYLDRIISLEFFLIWFIYNDILFSNKISINSLIQYLILTCFTVCFFGISGEDFVPLLVFISIFTVFLNYSTILKHLLYINPSSYSFKKLFICILLSLSVLVFFNQGGAFSQHSDQTTYSASIIPGNQNAKLFEVKVSTRPKWQYPPILEARKNFWERPDLLSLKEDVSSGSAIIGLYLKSSGLGILSFLILILLNYFVPDKTLSTSLKNMHHFNFVILTIMILGLLITIFTDFRFPTNWENTRFLQAGQLFSLYWVSLLADSFSRLKKIGFFLHVVLIAFALIPTLKLFLIPKIVDNLHIFVEMVKSGNWFT